MKAAERLGQFQLEFTPDKTCTAQPNPTNHDLKSEKSPASKRRSAKSIGGAQAERRRKSAEVGARTTWTAKCVRGNYQDSEEKKQAE